MGLDNFMNEFPLDKCGIDYIIVMVDSRQLVLDCFMGLATTGVACQKYNRDFLGIELNKEYFEIAQQRIIDSYGR